MDRCSIQQHRNRCWHHPGTTDDPVVTKSYVDQQIQQALNSGSGGSTNPTNPTNPTEPSTSTDEVKNVALKPGKILIADAGTGVHRAFR